MKKPSNVIAVSILNQIQSIVSVISLNNFRNSGSRLLISFFDVLSFLYTPVNRRSSQDYLSNLLDKLRTWSFDPPTLTQMLNLFKLLQIELPLILESLVSYFILPSGVHPLKIVFRSNVRIRYHRVLLAVWFPKSKIICLINDKRLASSRSLR